MIHLFSPNLFIFLVLDRYLFSFGPIIAGKYRDFIHLEKYTRVSSWETLMQNPNMERFGSKDCQINTYNCSPTTILL